MWCYFYSLSQTTPCHPRDVLLRTRHVLLAASLGLWLRRASVSGLLRKNFLQKSIRLSRGHIIATPDFAERFVFSYFGRSLYLACNLGHSSAENFIQAIL